MTREEIEEIIAYGKDYYRDLTTACCEIDEKHKEFVRMAIQALSQEPTKREIEREYLFQSLCEDFKILQAENDDLRRRLAQKAITTTNNNDPMTIIYPTIVCDDAIRRDAVIKIIEDAETARLRGDIDLLYAPILKKVNELPPVTPKQKSGKWITLENRFDLGDRVKCSECGQVFVVGDDVSRKYCPNCGSAMKGE